MWNLEGTAIARLLEHAAIHRLLGLGDSAENENRTAVPRMPPVVDYPRSSNMGVLLMACTIANAAIPLSVTSRRCSIWSTGSRPRKGRSRLHEPHRLEDEKQREPHRGGGLVVNVAGNWLHWGWGNQWWFAWRIGQPLPSSLLRPGGVVLSAHNTGVLAPRPGGRRRVRTELHRALAPEAHLLRRAVLGVHAGLHSLRRIGAVGLVAPSATPRCWQEQRRLTLRSSRPTPVWRPGRPVRFTMLQRSAGAPCLRGRLSSNVRFHDRHDASHLK